MAAPKITFHCAKCGHVHPSDYKTKWGSATGIGLGAIPICDRLVQHPIRKANEVCRGDLVAVAE